MSEPADIVGQRALDWLDEAGWKIERKNQWQTIETAPKDGSLILAWVIKAGWDVGEDVSSTRTTHHPFPAAVSWLADEWRFFEEFGFYMELEVSHWMPLLGPPKT